MNSRRANSVLSVLAVALVVWAVWPRMGGSESHARFGRTGDDGFDRFIAVAAEVGIELEPWRASLSLLPEAATLLLLAPENGPGPSEVTKLLEWVDAGGCLIYVPAISSADDRLLDALELESVRVGADDAEREVHPRSRAELESALAYALLADLDTPFSTRNHWLRAPASGSAEVVLGDASNRPDYAAHVVFPGAARRGRVGAGSVHVLASASSLRNAGLHVDGLALPLLRALALAPEPRFVDLRARFIDGGVHDQALSELALIYPSLPNVLLLGLLVALVVGWAYAFPLGSPREVARAPGPSSLEHVHALAAAWRQSDDESGAARRVAQGLGLSLRCVDQAALSSRLDLLRRRHPERREDVQLLQQVLDGGHSSLLAVAEAAARCRRAAAAPVSRNRSHG